MIFLLTIPVITVHAQRSHQKLTANPERLFSVAEYVRDGQPMHLSDSIRFFYSVARPSFYDHNNFRFLNVTTPDDHTSRTYVFCASKLHNIDSADVAHLGYDSFVHFQHPVVIPAPVLKKNTQSRTFNADGSINTVNTYSYAEDGSLTDSRRTVFQFAGGLMRKVTYMFPFGGSFADGYIRSLNYNASGHTTLDSLSVLPPSGGNGQVGYTYTYDAAGNYLSRTYFSRATGSAVDVQRSVNTYFSDGKLRTSAFEGAPNPGDPLVRSYLDSFVYLPGMSGYKDVYRTYFDINTGLPFSNMSIITNRINAAGQKDSVTETAVYSGIPSVRSSYKIDYNSVGNPVQVTRTDHNTTPPAVDRISRYYYEAYNTGTQNRSTLIDAIHIVPNPASGSIILHYPESLSGQSLSITITDATGRVMQSGIILMQGSAQEIRLREDAIPGIYYLNVVNGSGSRLGVKQFIKL